MNNAPLLGRGSQLEVPASTTFATGMDSDSVLSLSRSKVAVAHVEKTAALSLSGRWENYFALSLYSFAQSQAAFRFFIKNRQGQYYLHVNPNIL